MNQVTLGYPIEIQGATVSEVSVQRFATVEDLIIAGGDLDDEELHFRVAANLTGIAPQDFERLDFEDIERINDLIAALGEAGKTPLSAAVRRPTGRDIMDLKRDWKVPGLVKVISRLSGVGEDEIRAMEASSFLEEVNKLMGFLGRRGRK